MNSKTPKLSTKSAVNHELYFSIEMEKLEGLKMNEWGHGHFLRMKRTSSNGPCRTPKTGSRKVGTTGFDTRVRKNLWQYRLFFWLHSLTITVFANGMEKCSPFLQLPLKLQYYRNSTSTDFLSIYFLIFPKKRRRSLSWFSNGFTVYEKPKKKSHEN